MIKKHKFGLYVALTVLNLTFLLILINIANFGKDDKYSLILLVINILVVCQRMVIIWSSAQTSWPDCTTAVV